MPQDLTEFVIKQAALAWFEGLGYLTSRGTVWLRKKPFGMAACT